jgi:eukaryotic-like serine/threonine-protein kinase
MQLEPGTSVGSYKILAAIGAGGMGEVYRAEHVRLGREVAVKVLREVGGDKAESRGRFEREARVLALLNHPNIATLHGLEDCGDKTLLEMELVPGETLAELISRGPMSPAEALPIFKQIAQAFEAAHERGIIHRDLKPSNVKVTPDSRVKVLDFGLAKAFDPEGSGASAHPTQFVTATQPGLILGTAAYMSPEHVRGKPLDRRTDIWAFGCMFYEALTGKPPFAADTVSDTLAAVLREDPDWRLLYSAPSAVQRLIRRCLKKDPQDRLRDIADARLDIEEALSESASLIVPVPGHGGWRISRKRAIIGSTAALVVLAAVALAIWKLAPTTAPAGAVARLTVPIPAGQQVERGGTPLALSPDGTGLVYVAVPREGRTQLYMRRLDQFEPVAMAGTEGGSAPFFSPDGRWVGFYGNGALYRVSVEGGAALKICDAAAVWSSTWGTDDTIVFATSNPGGLWRVPAAGGTPDRLTSVDAAAGETQHAYPQWLPGGELLFGVATDSGWHVAVLSLQTKRWRAIGPPGSAGAAALYVPTGHLVYAHAGGLVAVPFDPARGIVGSPIPLRERPEADVAGSAAFTVSSSGTLAYIPRANTLPRRALVLVDREGRATLLSETRAAYTHPRLSRDGRRLAVAIESENGSDIWIYDLDRGTRARLTSGGVNRFPVWSSDGRQITYQVARSGNVTLYSRRVNDGSEPEPLFGRPSGDPSAGLSRVLAGLLPGTMPSFSAANPHLPMSWSPDGQHLAFDERKPSAERDIWVLRRGEDPSPFLLTPFDEWGSAFSPDGQWLTYVSDESGRNEVYVQPFPGPGGKWAVSTDGGTEPVWSPDGREIYFRRGGAVAAVALTVSPEFRVGRPRVLFESPYEEVEGARNYDVSADGRSFVVVRSEGAAIPEQFYVVVNWFADLRGRR